MIFGKPAFGLQDPSTPCLGAQSARFWTPKGGPNRAQNASRSAPRWDDNGVQLRTSPWSEPWGSQRRFRTRWLGLAPLCWDPGEGVGGGVNPSQRVENRRVEKKRGWKQTYHSKPPKPRGLVGFCFFDYLVDFWRLGPLKSCRASKKTLGDKRRAPDHEIFIKIWLFYV